MNQGDDHLPLPWQPIDFDDGWWSDNVWGDRATGNRYGGWATGDREWAASLATQEETARDPPIFSCPLEEPVWRTDTGQSSLLSFGIHDEWMQHHAHPAQTIDEFIPIYDPNDAQQGFASWEIRGQGDSSSAFAFGPMNHESQEKSHDNHTHHSLLGETLDGATTTIGDQIFGCMPEQAQSSLSGPVSRADFSSMSSVDTASSALRERTKQYPASSKRRASKDTKIKKPRISCTYQGCKLTFPRAYELQRHLDNVHERIIIPCIVYGCNRIARPVPRVDKFREHMRKHANAHTFVCAVEGCPAGPFDRDQLRQHLNTTHNMTSYDEVVVKERLRGISLRTTPQEDGSRFVEDWVNCPLSFLGCNFRAPHLEAFSPHHFMHQAHIQTHDLSERSKGYEAIRESGFNDYYVVARGVATCPICQKLVCKEDDYLGQFLTHLGKHTKEQRNPYIVGLWECIRPYAWWKHQSEFKMIQNEYEEATDLPHFTEN